VEAGSGEVTGAHRCGALSAVDLRVETAPRFSKVARLQHAGLKFLYAAHDLRAEAQRDALVEPVSLDFLWEVVAVDLEGGSSCAEGLPAEEDTGRRCGVAIGDEL